MNILAVGGSGIVGTIVIPFLQRDHAVRVYDLAPPKADGCDFVSGTVTDHQALCAATSGTDALIYMAMGNQRWAEWDGSQTAMDVNVKGLHFALRAAAESGITQAVYCSTMSVYANLQHRYFIDEDVEPDETNIYGFTKWLGEEVCRNASRRWAMNVSALRLCLPLAPEEWQARMRRDTPDFATSGDDVARAMLAALDLRAGFQAFMIGGDYEGKILNMAKAKRLLGWEPAARPTK